MRSPGSEVRWSRATRCADAVEDGEVLRAPRGPLGRRRAVAEQALERDPRIALLGSGIVGDAHEIAFEYTQL